MVKSKYAKRYPKEFRHQMVELHRAGRTLSDLARQFGPTPWACRQAGAPWWSGMACGDGHWNATFSAILDYQGSDVLYIPVRVGRRTDENPLDGVKPELVRGSAS